MRAAIYCRLSRNDSNTFHSSRPAESIRNQEMLLSEYAKQHGMQIYAIYVDENYSGLNPDRPAFCRLLDDARHGRFDIILCKSQSRFTRDQETAETYLNHLFPLWGIRFISLTDGIDTAEKKNRKVRQLNGLLNEWYCEDLSANIKTVFRKKMEAGQFIGSFACYGYTKDPSDHHKLLPDPPAAAVVRQIFELYLNGMSIRNIAKYLTEQKILRPSQYKRQCGLLFQSPFENNSSQSMPWSASTVKRILSNPLYTGCLVQGKEETLFCRSRQRIHIPKEQWIIVSDTHPPLISQDTFEMVQTKLLEKRKRK